MRDAIFVGLVFGFIVFCVYDTNAYIESKNPGDSWKYKVLPGGGFVARKKFGRR